MLTFIFVSNRCFSYQQQQNITLSEWHCHRFNVNLGSCLDRRARIPMDLLAVQEEEHWRELCKDGQANCS
jgi:hypothetical protein